MVSSKVSHDHMHIMHVMLGIKNSEYCIVIVQAALTPPFLSLNRKDL